MGTHRAGFTLVELMVVSFLTAVILGAVYQTLMVQQKSYEAANVLMHDQESLRTAIGILESELREVGSIGGAAIGGTDIEVAAPDSIVFRAQRKIGFTCKLDKGEHWLLVWTLGDPFETGVSDDAGDEVLLFVDGDSLRYTDDRWDRARVSNASTVSDSDCEAAWPGMPQQVLKLTALDLTGLSLGTHSLTGVQVGGPIRAYEWVTYSLQQFGSLGWALTRSQEGEEAQYLIGGLAPPGEGLRFAYYTAGGAATNDPTQVSRVEITVRTDPMAHTGVGASSMSTSLHLRNN